MYRFKHVAISNVCEESPTRPEFFLPAVVRMTFTKVHSPIILLSSHHPCLQSLPYWHMP